MSYIDITYELIDINAQRGDNVLVICPGFNINHNGKYRLRVNDPNMDLNDWIDHHIKTSGTQFDLIIMSRVFEHLPYRNLDFYLFNIYNIMKQGAMFIVIVPNMFEIFNQLSIETNKECPNEFRIMRLNFELFGEGGHIWDFHKIYTSTPRMKYLLEREGLFGIIKTETIIIETNIVPPYLVYYLERL